MGGNSLGYQSHLVCRCYSLEVTKDRQAIENGFFVDLDHPVYGKIKVLNNPIKLSLTEAQVQSKAPDLANIQMK